MSASLAPPVTDNTSTLKGGTVSRNECPTCEKYRRDTASDYHCRSCHSSKHCECCECSACLPNHHRWDRYYCSAKCRQAAHLRHCSPEAVAERERLAKDPERIRMFAEFEAAIEAMSGGTPEVRERRRARLKRLELARRTAEICASCGRLLDGLTVWWGPGDHVVDAPFAPRCVDCICVRDPDGRHRAHFCECCEPSHRRFHDHTGWRRGAGWSCRNAGPSHPDKFCKGCAPRHWADEEPCEGCGRGVRRWTLQESQRDYYRRYYREDRRRQHTFCSTRCRGDFFREEARERRVTARLDAGARLCAECREAIDGGRSDARYCSSACRQRAYRRRRLGAPA